MINYLKVSVDGEEVPEEDIRFTPDRIDWFTQKNGNRQCDQVGIWRTWNCQSIKRRWIK